MKKGTEKSGQGRLERNGWEQGRNSVGRTVLTEESPLSEQLKAKRTE